MCPRGISADCPTMCWTHRGCARYSRMVSDTLSLENQSISALKAVAIAWIDCDLYESTKPVLEFLAERLSPGSVICFDDWFNIKGRPDCGEQKACEEWLARNPQLRLTPYSRFGWHGQSFIVDHVS